MAITEHAFHGTPWKEIYCIANDAAKRFGCNQDEDLEDLTQETVNKVFLYGKKFDPKKGRISTYINTIARNLVIKNIQKTMRRNARGQKMDQDESELVLQHSRTSQSYSPIHELISEEVCDGINSCLESLTPDNQYIMRGRMEGAVYGAIAQTLGIHVSVVKKRVLSSRKEIAVKLAEQGLYAA